MPSSGPTTTNFGQQQDIVLKPNCSLRDYSCCSKQVTAVQLMHISLGIAIGTGD